MNFTEYYKSLDKDKQQQVINIMLLCQELGKQQRISPFSEKTKELEKLLQEYYKENK